MTLGVSLILIAVGAILVWGVNVNEENIDEDAIGVILMVIGLIGFLLSMIFWSQWSPVYRGSAGRRRYVRDDAAPVDPYAPRRTTYVEEDVSAGPPPGAPPPP